MRRQKYAVIVVAEGMEPRKALFRRYRACKLALCLLCHLISLPRRADVTVDAGHNCEVVETRSSQVMRARMPVATSSLRM